LARRFNALYVAGYFYEIINLQGLNDVPFCSFFLCFVFLLQQNCNGNLEQGIELNFSRFEL